MNVLTAGTFDLFHEGHVEFLRRCKDIAAGGSVTVALNTDEFIEAYKGRPPVIPWPRRAAVLRACRFVDFVVENPQLAVGDSVAPLLEWRPEGGLWVYGADWRPPRDYFAQVGMTHAEFDRAGWFLVSIPYTAGISTTAIRETIA